jgi:hypothetical protein
VQVQLFGADEREGAKVSRKSQEEDSEELERKEMSEEVM